MGLGEMLLTLFGSTLCLLYGGGRFICLLFIYAYSVDGSSSIISAALISAVCDVSGCQVCLCGNRSM
jgi:hypothetical protein